MTTFGGCAERAFRCSGTCHWVLAADAARINNDAYRSDLAYRRYSSELNRHSGLRTPPQHTIMRHW